MRLGVKAITSRFQKSLNYYVIKVRIMKRTNASNTRFSLHQALFIWLLILTSATACTSDVVGPEPDPCEANPTLDECQTVVDPPVGNRTIDIGAAYPNAGDSRIILINKEGTRFVYWTPSTGSFSSARSISELENGALPLGSVGASATTADGSETYFFDTAGSRFTVYERDTAEFDEEEEFDDDSGAFGDPEIEGVGAALHSTNTNRIFFFNGAGTKYAVWDYQNASWTRVYDFASEFGGGGAPIASVGAGVTVDGLYYLFNRDGTRYTIYAASGKFSSSFPLSELGNGSLSFD